MSIKDDVSRFASRYDTLDQKLLDHYDDFATRWEEETGKDRSQLASVYYIRSAAMLAASSAFFPGGMSASIVALYKAFTGHYVSRKHEEESMADFEVPKLVGKFIDFVNHDMGKMVTYMGIVSLPLAFFSPFYLAFSGALLTGGLGMKWWAAANYIHMSRKPIEFPSLEDELDIDITVVDGDEI